MADALEILCSACGAETIVSRKPVYEGFNKTGEVFVCVSCGHEYSRREDVPFKRRTSPSVFTEEDKTSDASVFAGDEVRNCRRCRHYAINPFVQRCALHMKEVEATDVCSDFEASGLEDRRSGG